MAKRNSKRTLAVVEAELQAARSAEHAAVERCSNARPASLDAAWSAADRVNALLRERRSILG